ncbi:hypothetical protein TASIC1_0010044000 [Trichoderma asperellum]|uniref:Uncharacterized protein n=1 Tax=Trichoderma asperellum TaxID=101201 RepID=A0A6V8R1C7_TRIAP|nr:hypothetical protein TASIC1_0010044000 [Trichoderma asperellum]
MDPQALGFESDLVFSDEIDNLLGIRNGERVNRSLATQDQIGKTGYSAYIRHVQYGTYENKYACLLGIDFAFRFPPKGIGRFSSAEVEVTFEKALDISKPALRSTDASLDPVVANFAPKQMLGQVKSWHNRKTFEISTPIIFNAPFGSAQLSAKWSQKTALTEDGQLEVNGNLAQDDDHDDGANSVTWDLIENPVSKNGILRSFRGVVVLFCHPDDALWIHVSVKPVMKFVLDPWRLMIKRLMSDRDDPVLLNGRRTLGSLSCLSHTKFDAEDFPWQDVLNLPQPLGVKEGEGLV